MSCQIPHSPLLSGEANEISAQLSQLHERLKQDAELAKLVPFSIQPRNQRDKNRFARLFSYTGPDKETLKLLESEALRWYDDPSSFALRSVPAYVPSSDPLVHLASRFLQLKHDDT